MSEACFEFVQTARLDLRMPTEDDLADLFALFSNPEVWADDPRARHASANETSRKLDRWLAAWAEQGLGIWIATSRERRSAGMFVGIGGCFVRHRAAWNLAYRLRPEFWGRGLAQEMIKEARFAAQALRPELPITAYVREGNNRSARTAERAGLDLVWQESSEPEDRQPVGLLFSDRQLSTETIAALIASWR